MIIVRLLVTILLLLIGVPVQALARTTWSYETLGSVWAAPLVNSSGNIYIGAEDGFFYAFAPTGRLLWSYKSSDGFSGWPLAYQQGILVGNRNGYLYLFDQDGEVKQRVALGGVTSGPPARWKQRFYLGIDSGHLLAFQGTKLLWSHGTKSPVTAWPVVDQRGRIYVGCQNGALFALSPQGQRLWQADLGSAVQGALVIHREGVMAVNASGQVVAVDQRGGIRWKQELHAADGGGATILGGAVFGTTEGHLVAVNFRGKPLWRFAADSAIKSIPTTTAGRIAFGTEKGTLYILNLQGQLLDLIQTGEAIRGGITLKAGTIIFGTHARRIHRLAREENQDLTVLKATLRNAHQGRTLWRQHLSGPVSRGVATGIGGQKILAGTLGNKIFLLGPEGKVEWTYNCGADVETLPAMSPQGDITFGCNDGGFYGLKPSGDLRFRFPVNKRIASSPAIARDGTIYFGASDHRFYALDKSGKMNWRIRTGDEIDSAPRISPEGIIYFGSDDRHLYAMSPLGHIHWYYRTGGPLRARVALGPQGTIFAPSFDQRLYAVTSSGEVKWSFQTDGQLKSSPLVGPGSVIFFGSRDHFIYALSPAGKLLWRFQTGGEVDSDPVLFDDNTLVVGSDDGNLYALSPDNGSLKWWFPAGAEIQGTLLARSNNIVFGTMDGSVFAVAPPDLASNDSVPFAPGPERFWQAHVGRGRGGPLFLNSDGGVILAGQDGIVRALGADQWPLWSVKVSDTPLSPLVAIGQTFYLTDRLGNLAAIHKGQLRLLLRLDQDALSPPVLCPAPDGPLILSGSSSGRLWAVTPAGKVRWFFSGSAAITHHPLVVDGLIYLTFPTSLVALDFLGQKRWETKLPAGLSHPPLQLGSSVVVADGHGTIHAFSAAGKMSWKKNLGGALQRLIAVGDGTSLLVLAPFGRLWELSATGRILNEHSFALPIRNMAADQSRYVLLERLDGGLLLFDRHDGSTRRILELASETIDLASGWEGTWGLVTQDGLVIKITKQK